jgi:two-component system chemotaxis response regulator CheB
MPALLERLVKQPAGEERPVPGNLRYEVEVARSGRASMNDMDSIGQRSVLTCPDCNGVLWEIDENELIRFRCHLGHAFGAELINLAIEENLRRALGSALRALEERTALIEKLRNQAVAQGHNQVAEHWTRKKEESEQETDVIRQAIIRADEIAAAAVA